ncbi:translation initiation factor IF-3 [Candidatus Saccharibacteria bacterium QS_5_54_17]|nr:MAG: translation initiation factor IF-3 [Candidatus Saccharibacteria bacterium QS_5_54_17]
MQASKKRGVTIKNPRVNQEIKASRVRLVDVDGNQVDVMSLQEARDRAEEDGYDLVEMAPQAEPPVVKMVNWGKYQYEKTKQEQLERQKNKAREMKQIRLGLKIGQHDLEVKQKHLRQFLEKGHKVKLTVRFRGREITHEELGHDLLQRVADSVSDIATVDQPPEISGKQLSMVLRKQ